MFKLVVGINPNDADEFGYVAGCNNNFGVCIPESIDGVMIDNFVSKGGVVTLAIASAVFGSSMSIVTASGIAGTLTWDSGEGFYSGTALGTTFRDHYDLAGVLEMALTEPVLIKPDAPDAPTFSDIADTSAKVLWTAPTGGDVDNYKVYVTDGGSDISGSPFTMAGSTLTKTLSGLTASTAYQVSIEAINTAGSSTSAESTLNTTA